MKDQIDILLDMMGFELHTVQIAETNDGHISILYPNYFTLYRLKDRNYTDEQLYMEVKKAIYEHRDNVNNDIIMIERFGKMMGYGKEVE